MEDKIIEIIKNEPKALDAVEIMNIINPDYTAGELKEIYKILNDMCFDGTLRVTKKGGYVINELLTGIVDMHEKGNAHILIKDGDDIFIPKDKMKGASDKDLVSYEITDKTKNEGRILKVLKRSLGTSVGKIVNENGKLNLVMRGKPLPYEVVVNVDDCDFSLVDGLYVHLEYVKDINKNAVLAKIDYPIGHENAAGKDTEYALIATEFNVHLFFPEAVEEERKRIPLAITEEEIKSALEKGVVDHRGDIVTTTDGKDTKDIDDAIQVEMLPNGNYRVIVHIADVSRYVKSGTAIWDFAYLKGNSDYFANKVGPMLPIELSNGICSLNPNEDRFAISCEMEMDHSGKVLNRDVHMSLINSKKKMNYDAVQDIIENKETEDTESYTTLKYTVKDGEDINSIAFKNCITVDELLEYNKLEDFIPGNEVNIPTKSVVKLMSKISKIMGANFERRGKIDFEGSEYKHVFDENDLPIDKVKRTQRESEQIIEHFMIYANENFAGYVCDNLAPVVKGMVPFVFRVHGNPNPKRVEQFMKMLEVFGIHYPKNIDPNNVSSGDIQELLEFLRDDSHFEFFNDRLLRCMQKAIYYESNNGHFGIASDLYCHFTSPIRRMSDLLVHTIYRELLVEKNISEQNIDRWLSFLPEACEHISECERVSESYERAILDYNDAVMMQNEIGKSFEATIVDAFNGFFFVETTDKHIEGRVDSTLTYEAHDELQTLNEDEVYAFLDSNLKPLAFDYDDEKFAYTKKGRTVLQVGDTIEVDCIDADPEAREVDFAYVRKK